jgi:ATP-GRASP peptide maturase of grasp-with-spasm system
MILILSHEFIDEPTNNIIDWLSYYKADFIRLNGDDFSFTKNLKIDINNNEITDNNGQTISAKDINVVWFRRWKHPDNQKTHFEKYLELGYTNAEVLVLEKYEKHLKQEDAKLNSGIFSVFKNKFWIPKPANARGNLNKLDVLLRAKDFGLTIPNTIVTSNKEDVHEFYKANGSIITKPINEANTMSYKDIQIPMFTKELASSDIDKFPDIFFPSLFQKNIAKNFEIRTFIHMKKAYSMALFSQNDKQTSADFRNYNIDKPNRYVPFLLPKDIEEKLLNLLENLQLNTGSIDLIYDNDGNYVFLEINPVGQFGMVSLSCNYHVEKMIAEDLIRLDLETAV